MSAIKRLVDIYCRLEIATAEVELSLDRGSVRKLWYPLRDLRCVTSSLRGAGWRGRQRRIVGVPADIRGLTELGGLLGKHVSSAAAALGELRSSGLVPEPLLGPIASQIDKLAALRDEADAPTTKEKK